MQVAPHANPISLIRVLLDEANRAHDRVNPGGFLKPDNRNMKPMSSLACMRWKRAIEYAKGIAVTQLHTKQPQNTFAYRWPTVNALKQVKSKLMDTPSEPVARDAPANTTSSNARRRYSSSQLDDDDDESPFDGPLDVDSKQSAFDQITDDEPDLVIEPAEADTSSGEEQMVEFDSEPRKHRSSGGKFCSGNRLAPD